MYLKEIAKYDNFYIAYDASLKEAIKKMNLNGNGSVVLLNKDFPVAMLTQSDIIGALGKESDLDMNIYHYATQLVISVKEDSPIEFAMKLFLEHNIRRIVLVDKDKRFTGVVLQERLFDYLGEDIYKYKFQEEVDKQISKRLENEYLLMQQSKLATMGEMIGHIAHQWRQPLAQLGGVFMNLESTYAFGQLDKHYFEEKMENGNKLIKHMSQTIEDFRHFFVPQQEEESFKPSVYIQRAIDIIEATLTYHHIRLEVIAPDDEVLLYGYASEFSQVILNLIDNAKDVLVEREVSPAYITIETKLKDNEVFICVKDNAGGIDEKIVTQLFDIYFTTKLKKGGSGLGLYISKLIVESKLKGKIYATNDKDGANIYMVLKKRA